jgi:hypothetical protein
MVNTVKISKKKDTGDKLQNLHFERQAPIYTLGKTFEKTFNKLPYNLTNVINDDKNKCIHKYGGEVGRDQFINMLKTYTTNLTLNTHEFEITDDNNLFLNEHAQKP